MWPYLVIFLSSAFTMTLELVASRLVAPVLGVSLYTWTSVIGVVLAGMSLGSFVGGFMADGWNPRRLLGPVLMIAGMVVAAIVPAIPVLGVALPNIKQPLARVVLPIALLFGIPCFVMGLISPLVYRISLSDTSRTGVTVGRLAASGSLGSIVGTFATGFWLIPTFGTRAITITVAAGLFLLGIATFRWRKRSVAYFLTLAVLISAGSGARVINARSTQEKVVESAYYTIKVMTSYDSDASGELKTLVLDNLVHSAASTSDPDYLWYEYERVAAWVIDNVAPDGLQVLFIGGGGYTLPHWVELHYPDAQVEVIEIDPEVTRVALQEFVPASHRITTYNEDARTAIKNIDVSRKYHLIFGDAFNDVSVPYHLTTEEFTRKIRERLTDDGVYMANVIDIAGGKFLNAYATTLSEVFRHVVVLPGSGSTAAGRSPYLVLASDHELPVSSWSQPTGVSFTVAASKPEPGGLVLTDDYAPTDYLLLPVITQKLVR